MPSAREAGLGSKRPEALLLAWALPVTIQVTSASLPALQGGVKSSAPPLEGLSLSPTLGSSEL